MAVPPIEDSFEKVDKYPTVVERYYSKYHFTPAALPADETHCILVHSNRICLVTLAETHPVVRDKKTISKLDFQVSGKVDRLNNKVRGKGKKGGQFLIQTALLCFIECSDGCRYNVHGCVKGKLIEINQNIVENPQLLVEKPLAEGYIAIVLPHLKDIEDQKNGFELIQASMASSELLDVEGC